jgi:hypothetical protein
VRKADRHHRAGAALGQALRCLLALRRAADLEFEIRLAGGLLPALGAGVGRLAEGLVALAAGLVDDRRLVCRRGGSQPENGERERRLQNCARNCAPQVRGSLMKPVRLLKSMPPTMRI